MVTVGSGHTCALFMNNRAKCWGYGYEGGLGYGNRSFIGDLDTPADHGYIQVE